MTTPRSFSEQAVFVDASAFYAQLDRSDRWHTAAQETFVQLAGERRPLFTSNLAVAETYALAGARLSRSVAFEWLNASDVVILYEDEHHHARALSLLQQYHDKTFSYADVVAFAMMERLETQTAFAFDDDFRQLGRLMVLPASR